MQDHQFLKSCPQAKLNIPRVIALWLFPKETSLLPISENEQAWGEELPAKRSWQYRQARGCARAALSDLWGIPPNEIPLTASPGEPPTLGKGFGYTSFSHCKDAVLIGWSSKPIGIDLERADRSFPAKALSERYFSDEEKAKIRLLEGEELHSVVLNNWLIKEAAIKWQKSNLASGLSEWKYMPNSNYALHKSLRYKLGVNLIEHGPWRMAIGCNGLKSYYQPILCIY